MKKISLFLSLLFFGLFSSQTNSNVSEVGKIKSYVNSLIQKDDAKNIKYYYRLDSDLPAVDEKTWNDSDKDWEVLYKIYQRTGKVVFIVKAYPGSSNEEYGYYFNDDGKVIGASKTISFATGSTSCSWFVKYYSEYVFNFISGDWEKSKTLVYNYDTGKKINLDVPKCTNVKRDLEGYVGRLESINKYSDLKSFLNGNKINL
ncbi:MAG: hypothetical protein E2590_07215 [Chryseobacterium sp.]|nr:hypothetical protein [Chryseobacterium sp.]